MSLYKVGDKVKIKSHYDEGCTGDSYPAGFTTTMLSEYGGKVCTISSVEKRFGSDCYQTIFPKTFNGDATAYRLVEDFGCYVWHSSMFEPEIISQQIDIF